MPEAIEDAKFMPIHPASKQSFDNLVKDQTVLCPDTDELSFYGGWNTDKSRTILVLL